MDWLNFCDKSTITLLLSQWEKTTNIYCMGICKVWRKLKCQMCDCCSRQLIFAISWGMCMKNQLSRTKNKLLSQLGTYWQAQVLKKRTNRIKWEIMWAIRVVRNPWAMWAEAERPPKKKIKVGREVGAEAKVCRWCK